MMKTCLRCKVSKPFESFGAWRYSKDGRQVWCRQCRSKYQQEHRLTEKERARRWYQANKERHYLDNKKWRAENPQKASIIKRNYKGRRRATGGNVTSQEWLDRLAEFNNHCAYCNTLDSNLEMEHMVPLSRSGAHEIDNLVPACRRCNAEKHTQTLLEFISR